MAVLNEVQWGQQISYTGQVFNYTLTNPVDRSKAFLVFHIYYNAHTTTASNNLFRGSIASDGRSITIRRAAGTNSVDIVWYVVDFVSGVSVQHFETTLSTSATSQIQTISAVDVSKTIVLHNVTTSQGNYGTKQFVKTKLTSSTNLTLTWGGTGTSTDIVSGQVITFDECRVAYLEGQLASTATATADLTVPFTFDVGKVWNIPTWYFTSHTASNLAQKCLVSYPTSSSAVKLDRNSTGNAINYGLYVLEFTGNAKATRFYQTLTGTTTSQLHTHASHVNLYNSVPVMMGLGNNCGRAAWTSDARISAFAGYIEPIEATVSKMWRETNGASVSTLFISNALEFSPAPPAIDVDISGYVQPQTLGAVSNRISPVLWSSDSTPVLGDVSVVSITQINIEGVIQPQDLAILGAGIAVGTVIQEIYIPEFDFAAWVYGVNQTQTLGDVTFSVGEDVLIEGVSQSITTGVVTNTLTPVLWSADSAPALGIVTIEEVPYISIDAITLTSTTGFVSNATTSVLWSADSTPVLGEVTVEQTPYISIDAVSQSSTLGLVSNVTITALWSVDSSPVLGDVSAVQSIGIGAASQAQTLGSITTGFTREVSTVVQSIFLADVTNLNTTGIEGVGQGSTFGALSTAAEINGVIQSITLGEVDRLIPIDVAIGVVAQGQTFGDVEVQLNNQILPSAVQQIITLGQVASTTAVNVSSYTQTAVVSDVGYALAVHIREASQEQTLGYISTDAGVPIDGVSQSQSLGGLHTGTEIDGISQGQTFGALSTALSGTIVVSGISQPQTFAPSSNHLNALALGHVLNYTLSALAFAVEMGGVVQGLVLQSFTLRVEMDGCNVIPVLGAIDEGQRWAVSGGVWKAIIVTGKPDIIVGGQKVKISKYAHSQEVIDLKQYVDPLLH